MFLLTYFCIFLLPNSNKNKYAVKSLLIFLFVGPSTLYSGILTYCALVHHKHNIPT